MAVNRRSGHDEINADHQKRHERDDLDETEPEFQFAKHLHRHEVHRQHDDKRRQREYPLVNALQPGHIVLEEIHVERNRRHVGDRGHGPVEPVHPACHESQLLAVELAGIGDEGAGAGAMHDEFAQGAQHQKRKETAQGIDQDESRARQRQTSASAEKEPGSDCAADGDHLDLPRSQGLVIAAFLFDEHFAWGRDGFHGFSRHCSSLRARFTGTAMGRARPLRARRQPFNEGRISSRSMGYSVKLHDRFWRF